MPEQPKPSECESAPTMVNFGTMALVGIGAVEAYRRHFTDEETADESIAEPGLSPDSDD
jgi:hypothetical protein